MGGKSHKRMHTDGSSSSSSDDSLERLRRHRKDRQRSSRREKERRREREEKRRKKRENERRKCRRENKRNMDYDSDPGRSRVDPEMVLSDLFREFPNVGNELQQLLQMIDGGQAVDIRGISQSSLNKHLKKLFLALNLKENGDRIFILPSNAHPTWDVVGPLIQTQSEPREQQIDHSQPLNEIHSIASDAEGRQVIPDSNLTMPYPTNDSSAPNRRLIGPEMPSAELLAAAAKLTEAHAELREAEMEEDDELFVGPPPPAVVAEAESANEAERFEEVSRIMGVEADSPYDVIGVNSKMSVDNVKKRYWKLSLLVHPDKCSHPQAHQAFIILNKAFKELQDPEKRKAMDEKIKLKEEQEAFKAELKAMREAAQWRRLQGLSMDGDDELLAVTEVKVVPKRDEWMTTLPPERKPGMPMHSTKFGKSSNKGRGDTSVWTDTPSDRAQKAKINYLEAYNETAALASNDAEKIRASADGELVDKYNKARRSKSEQKFKEGASGSKKKSKEKQIEEWVGQHPWKPWDRDKDLTARRQGIKFDSEDMAQGLSSRFSAGNFQRNFL
ncbi:DnaJ domain-containing protein/DUF3752 domain-containing protein [Cephalotus follicularis]|uniref:DnaJ domain-containing protein/DUF3752 domain-containing protein n=1 Tax=Cephalotus follicularis TaxID=3775 RepID=A0A1Q3ARN6_CEPFO|nr:DnaJ domain-containing protein/DUF3752 domain-containing protein [Cephalotus follicularis]